MLKSRLLMSAASFVMLMASASLAQAQDAGAPGSEENVASPGDPVSSQERGNEPGEIVVTGSRISRRDYSSESPIVTLSQDAVAVSGQQTLGEALNQLPQLTPGNSATSSTRGNAGQTNPDLRGLGSRRTLVLLDGRRLQPSDSFNAIDLNTVPGALIENVEIITGGASAIYGSDALAGVINLRTRKNFSGLEIDAQTGLTSRQDGGNYGITVTGGLNFGDGRGNVVVSGSYLQREAIFPQSSRPFFSEFNTLAVSPTGRYALTGVPQSAINSLFNSYGITDPSRIPTPVDQVAINPDGTLFVYQSPNPLAAGSNFKPAGQPALRWVNGIPQGRIVDNRLLASPIERYSAFGRFSYELTDNLSVFAQGNYTRYETRVGGGGAQITSAAPPVGTTNPFYRETDLPLLYDRRASNNALNVQVNNYPVPDPTNIRNTLYQVQAGLSGKIPGLGWSWEAYYARGEAKQRITDHNKVSRTGFLALTSAADGGRSQCTGGLDLFPVLSISPECADILLTDAVSYQTLKQDVAEFNLQGGLFRLPAGEVRFATGAAYRKNSFSFDPDPRLAPVGATQQTEVFGYGSFFALPTSGSTHVTEGFGELLIPILADTPVFRRLELDVAYRYSSYDTVGGVHTYKAGVEWELFKGVLLRGGYQRAIRAPSVGELFAPAVRGVGEIGNIATGGGDPCSIRSTSRAVGAPNADKVAALCIATGVPANLIGGTRSLASQTTIILAGNPDLSEENSDSYTFGGVLQPRFSSPFLSRLSLSVDYFQIKIRDALGNRQARDVLDTCYNLNGQNPTYSATNPSCLLITRAGPDQPNRIGDLDGTRTPTINLASYQTSGIDAQFDYTFPLDELFTKAGSLSFNVIATYLLSYKLQNSAAAPLNEFVGTIGNAAISGLSHPRWKGLTTITYRNGPAEIGTRVRYIGPMSNAANVGTTATQAGIKDIIYTDLFGRFSVGEQFELRAGVTNLFDKMPPIFTGENATDPATYDVIGRSFYIGAKVSF